MELFLVRHAIAEPGADDAARPLSKKGKQRFSEVVKGLEALELRFDQLFHSPKLRAVQTAALLERRCDGKLVSTPLLARAPGVELLELFSEARVAVVGHEPFLTRLLAWLVTGHAANGVMFELKKGGIARLEGEATPGGMKLTALWTPKGLRR